MDLEYTKGWLVKKGKIHRNWLRRFFVLHPSHLEYFTSEKCTRSKGIVPLRDAFCYPLELTEVSKPFMIALQTEKRTFYFQAASQDEAQAWQSAICNTITALALGQGLRRQPSVIDYCSPPLSLPQKSLPTPPLSLASTPTDSDSAPTDLSLTESCNEMDVSDGQMSSYESSETESSEGGLTPRDSLSGSGGNGECYDYYDMQAIVSSAETKHGFTAYRIDMSWRGYNWTIFRRYKQFFELHGNLESVLGQVTFPSKTLVHKFGDEFVERRRRLLNRYMRACTNNLSRILGRPNKKKHFFWFIRPFQLGDVKGNTCATAPFK